MVLRVVVCFSNHISSIFAHFLWVIILEYWADKYKVQKMFTLYLKKVLTFRTLRFFIFHLVRLVLTCKNCSSVVSMKYIMVNMIFARNVENVVVAQDYFISIFGKTEGNHQQNWKKESNHKFERKKHKSSKVLIYLWIIFKYNWWKFFSLLISKINLFFEFRTIITWLFKCNWWIQWI